MFRMHRSRTVALAAIVALGLALGAANIVLAQAPSELVSRYVTTSASLTDPLAPVWSNVPAVEMPLTAQSAAPPALLKQSVRSVRVRSVNDGQWISFLLEWDDSTRDVRASRPDEFRDAAAIQLPVDASIPGGCMGARGLPTNLWHWKGDWQNDIDKGFQDVTQAYPNFWKDYYPFVVGKPPYQVPADFPSTDARTYMVGWSVGNPLSQPMRVTPVEELAAHGFGTATSRSSQNVLGRGAWQNGVWRVVFSRPMALSETDTVQFVPGGTAHAAFAVWNGSNQEVGARKQLSSDVTLSIEGNPSSTLPWWVIIAAGLLALAFGGAVVYAYIGLTGPRTS